MKGKGWRGESRRHSMARKGVSTNIDEDRRFDVSNFVARGVYGKETYLNVFTHEIKGMSEEDYQDFRDILEDRVADALNHQFHKKTNNYPSKKERDRIREKIKLMDMEELVEVIQKNKISTISHVSDIYKVKEHAEYVITLDSTTRFPSGKKDLKLRWGDTLVLLDKAIDGTFWFVHKGKIGKHTYGSLGGINKDPNLERITMRDD